MSEPAQPPEPKRPRENWRALLGLVLSSAVVASLCCLPSVVLVLFGLASVSTAAALSDRLYWGPTRYVLYAMSLALAVAGLVLYFRRQGICTLDAARRERNRIRNLALLVLLGGVLTYLVWNYILLDLLGIAVGLPWNMPSWWPSS
ncbi:MAG: hypothetical protein RL514_56 [Verrucomicrobiota bacterium]|jgi:magnesium-transporting ATPase (P-type)